MPWLRRTSLPVDILPTVLKRRIFTISFGLGYLFGYISWIVGAVFALYGTRSLIQVVKHRSNWLAFLDTYAGKLAATQGRVVQKTLLKDPWTGDISHLMEIEYTSTASQSVTKTLEGSAARLLFEHYEQGQFIALKMISGHPQLAVPSRLLHYKLFDCILWARYIDVGVAFVCLHLYMFGALTYSFWVAPTQPFAAFVDIFWILVTLAALSPLLMTPYIIVEQSVKQEQRMLLLTTDPVKLETEFDQIRNLWYGLGPTFTRKMNAIFLPLGILQMLFCSGWGVIPGFLAVWALTQLTESVPTRQEFLSNFEMQSDKVGGTLVAYRHDKATKTYHATLHYTAASGEVVEKNILSRELYDLCQEQNVAPSIDVAVLPEHPLSGYPRGLLRRDISKRWSITSLQVLASLSVTVYLVYTWMLLMDDYWWELPDAVVFALAIGIGPGMIFPQVCVLHRVGHKAFMVQVLENGIVIKDVSADMSC